MQFISQNWGWIAGISGIVLTFSGAIYKLVVMDSVKKSELYGKDGQPIYRHRSACQGIVKDIKEGVDSIKGSVEELDKTIQRDRITQNSFMSAVKENLDLKFTIPKP